MTLGCAYWIFDDDRDVSYTYLEFSFRDLLIANDKTFVLQLDEKFSAFLQEDKENLAIDFGVPAEAIPSAVNYLSWSYRLFSYFESDERILLYFQAGSPRHQDLEVFLNLLHRFLTQYLVVPS